MNLQDLTDKQIILRTVEMLHKQRVELLLPRPLELAPEKSGPDRILQGYIDRDRELAELAARLERLGEAMPD